MLDTLGYTGAYRDAVLGGYLLGNGYRCYLPGLMRFCTQDDLSPFGEGGINPYAYCGADPINRSDPSGHISVEGFAATLAEETTAQAVHEASTTLAAREAASAASTGAELGAHTVDDLPATSQATGRASRKRAATSESEAPASKISRYGMHLGPADPLAPSVVSAVRTDPGMEEPRAISRAGREPRPFVPRPTPLPGIASFHDPHQALNLSWTGGDLDGVMTAIRHNKSYVDNALSTFRAHLASNYRVLSLSSGLSRAATSRLESQLEHTLLARARGLRVEINTVFDLQRIGTLPQGYQEEFLQIRNDIEWLSRG